MPPSASPEEADENGATTAAAALPSPPLLTLPDDILGLISASLNPSDLASLIVTCRALRTALSTSDKAWLPQCSGLLPTAPPSLLSTWRRHLPSYRNLCRFLLAVRPFLGAVWVHQNPELGNVVWFLPGFLSVIACRVIPQELGPLGLHRSPLLYTPVFEILAAPDGSIAGFFLHGREEVSKDDAMCPGEVRCIDPNCNVLYLEAEEPASNSKISQQLAHLPKMLLHSKSALSASTSTTSTATTTTSSPPSSNSSSPPPPPLLQRRLCRSDTTIPRLSVYPPPPFGRLAFGDRRKLLELVTSKVRLAQDLANSPLFLHPDCIHNATYTAQLADRWTALLQLIKAGPGCVDKKQVKSALDVTSPSGNGSAKASGTSDSSGNSDEKRRSSFTSTVGVYFKSMILGKGGSSSSSSSSSSSEESKHVPLHDFLRSRSVVGLSLRAANVKLSTYRAWPNMHDNRFALYKLPIQPPADGRELSGLWGGTFGWPPGQASEDKQGKALFFLLLSYVKLDGVIQLLATKILEGTHYVLHPNGSAMFIVNVESSSTEPFPWETHGDGRPVDVKQAYSGEGIANGYGFRYPGSKPGSLYVINDGQLLAFVWSESKAVLNLQRLDMQELIMRGERVPSPPPVSNFAYLTKSYSNVFAGYATNSGSSNAQVASAAQVCCASGIRRA